MHKITDICLLMALVAMLTGCAKAPQTALPASLPDGLSNSLILGYSQLGSESGWRIGNSKSIADAAKKADVQLVFDNAEQKQEKQIKAIRSFIAYQVDVIAFSPIVEDGWDFVLQEAKTAGIPVLLVDRNIQTIDESLYAGFIGSDFMDEGRKAGEFLKRKMADREKVNIVELTGTEDSTPMRQRSEGFWTELGQDPKYHALVSVSGDFMRSKGKESMEKLLKSYANIDVLYSHNDQMTLGAIEAIQSVGLESGKDIVIITVDGEQEAIDLLKVGKINCVVECSPRLGDTVMRLAKQLTAGETIARQTFSEEAVFCEYDDLTALEPRGY